MAGKEILKTKEKSNAEDISSQLATNSNISTARNLDFETLSVASTSKRSIEPKTGKNFFVYQKTRFLNKNLQKFQKSFILIIKYIL